MQGHGNAAAFDLDKELRTIINKFRKENFKYTQETLAEVGNNMAQILSRNTPTTKGTGLFRSSFKVKPYVNSVYVYNDRGAKGINAGIPISNLAEYSKRGPKPFILNTFNSNKVQIYNDFIKIMQQKLNK